MAILQLKRTESPTTAKELGEANQIKGSTAEEEESCVSSPSTAPTPTKAEPAGKSTKKTLRAKSGLLVKTKSILKPKLSPIKEDAAEDENIATQAEPLSGKELYIESRRDVIIAANEGTAHIEDLALLKGHEEWEKMTMDERCPWEEQAEKLAEGSVAERPRKKAKTLVSQAPKQPKTPYILFLDAHHTLVKEQNPSFSFGELAEELRAMWHALLKEKKKYQGQADGAQDGHKITLGVSILQAKGVSNATGKKKAPSSYQMFVKQMSKQLQQEHPGYKQSEKMRKIGELWRNLAAGEREQYAQDAKVQEAAIAQGGGGAASASAGIVRSLSNYHLYVKHMLSQLKTESPQSGQNERMKKIGELWRAMTADEKASWCADGEQGSRVPGENTYVVQRKMQNEPSAYQSFVKHMVMELRKQHPEKRQHEHMRKIGELWREMSGEEKAKYRSTST